MKTIISTDKAPAAIGPYSQGVRAGDFIFFSGQIPLVPETGQLVQGGIEAQVDQVLQNMIGALAGADLSPESVVKVGIFVTDLQHFELVNQKYGALFSERPPARAVVEVAALPKGAMIEIEWVAYDA